MDTQITTALVALGVTVIGALGTLVTLLVEKVRRDLQHNTRLTQEAKEAANGQLRNALDQLAAVRNQVVGLRAVVREREDRFAYILARHPEIEQTLKGYQERRTRRATELEEARAIERFAGDDSTAPAGN